MPSPSWLMFDALRGLLSFLLIIAHCIGRREHYRVFGSRSAHQTTKCRVARSSNYEVFALIKRRLQTGPDSRSSNDKILGGWSTHQRTRSSLPLINQLFTNNGVSRLSNDKLLGCLAPQTTKY